MKLKRERKKSPVPIQSTSYLLSHKLSPESELKVGGDPPLCPSTVSLKAAAKRPLCVGVINSLRMSSRVDGSRQKGTASQLNHSQSFSSLKRINISCKEDEVVSVWGVARPAEPLHVWTNHVPPCGQRVDRLVGVLNSNNAGFCSSSFFSEVLLRSLTYRNSNLTLRSWLLFLFLGGGGVSLETFSSWSKTVFGPVLFIFALSRTLSGVSFHWQVNPPSERLRNKNKCIQISA